MAVKDVECCDEILVHDDLVKAVRAHIPDEDKLYDLAEIFKVFGDSTRIRILYVLFESEMCVCDIAQALNMTQSAISHQLKILKQSKLVSNRREGNLSFIFWRMDMSERLLTKDLNILKNNWEEANERNRD